MREEITLPVSCFQRYGFRAFRERDAISFEPASPPERTSPLGVVVLVALVALSAAGYVAITNAITKSGNGPEWWFHFLVASFVVLLIAAVGFRWRFDSQYLGATLSRNGLSTLQLAYRWKSRGERVHHFREPACVQILLRHDFDGTTSWHDVAQDGTGVRQEKFRDQIEIELLLRGTAVKPRIPILTSRWKHLAPSMYLYFTELDLDSNRAIAVETMRPLADAVRDHLRIPVEIRVAGGPLLQRLEPGDTAKSRSSAR